MMKYVVLISSLLMVRCVTTPVDSTSQAVPPPASVYKNIPYLEIVEDSINLIGVYDNARGFGNRGIELEEEGSFRRWEPGAWDGPKKIHYREAIWLFEDGLLTLNYQKLFSKRMQRKLDVVVFEDRIFLVPVNEREDFITKVREHERSIASTDQHIISFESLTESYLSKPDDL